MSNGPVFNFEGEYARSYDGFIRLACPGYDTLYQMEEALLHTLLGERAHVLIAGAGGGIEVQTFAPVNPNWRFTGVDPSSVMIESAQGKATASELNERVFLHHGYVHELPENEMFDGGTCNLVLHFLPREDKVFLLESIYDRLKPGAPFLCSTMHAGTGDDFQLHLNALYRMALQAGVPQEKLDSMKDSLSSEMHLLLEEQTADLIRQAGFEKVTRFHTGLYITGWVARKPD